MKSILALLILAPAFSFALSANPKCGLPATTVEGEGLEEVSPTQFIDVSGLSRFQIKSLSRLIKQQLIISANQQDSRVKLKFSDENLMQAIESLREASEAGDLSVAILSYGGREISYIMYYPGGNEGGFIFERNSAKLIAVVGDQDINCWKPSLF